MILEHLLLSFLALCVPGGVQGILLSDGAQRFTDLDLQPLLRAFLDKLRGQRLEPWVA